MTLFEIAAALDSQVVLSPIPPFIGAYLQDVYLHKDGAFIGFVSTGHTPFEALENLAARLRGQRLCNKRGVKPMSLEGRWLTLGESQIDIGVYKSL